LGDDAEARFALTVARANGTGTWQAMQRSFYGFAEAEALFAAP
jgi:hypothetical protein